MQKYKCHKVVTASKIHAINGTVLNLDPGQLEQSAEWFAKHNPQVGGYYVVYEDGYASYSPAKAFEDGYSPLVESCDESPRTDKLTFGEALEYLKLGKRTARKGWDGKGMFLWLLPAGEVPKSAIFDPALRAVIDQHTEGDTFTALPSIRMWTRDAEGRWGVLTGWLASQTDMLSDDWEIVG